MSGVPCALSPRERAVISAWCRGTSVLELGALLGGSTIAIATVARRVISVDPHAGYRGDTERAFRSNLDRAGVAYKADVVVSDFRHLRELPMSERAFIDLTGSHALTEEALRAVQAEIVLVHDVGRQRCEGVATAIAAAGYEVLEHVDTIAVCRRRP